MTAEGARFFIIIFCAVLPLAGFLAELLICRMKNENAKLVLPLGGILLYVVCAFIENDFYGGSAAVLGAITAGAWMMLLINAIFKKKN